MTPELERIKSIKTFPSLVRYLRDELDWKIDDADIEDLTFDYEADELGLDKETAVKVKEIKQLRPMATNQPWGIFYLSFEKKRLPIVALRRILRSLVIKKRASANKSQMATWNLHDLLFISSYGEERDRELTFAHFSDNSGAGDLPTLKVLGWNPGQTVLRLQDTVERLHEDLHWPDDESDIDAWRRQWSSAFTLGYRETVRTSKELAVKLADLAIDIRKNVNAVLSIESEKGELRKLCKAFQEALIHDLTGDDFADMYAQTIAYGLLSARISRSSGALVAENVSDLIPNTNPFLKELMQTFITVGGRKSKIDFDELGINEVVELLRRANMEEVLRDFGAKNPNEDPVIHFYELFLKEYDPEKRMKRGVFYTPKPVVSFIVRSVHEILQTEFGLEDGLADTITWAEFLSEQPAVAGGLTLPEGVSPDSHFVQILDPATGTGTFLVEVIDLIYKTMTETWKREKKSDKDTRDLWNDYVPRHLLPRIYGFELMMAPYSIAHMKIGLKLRETGYSFLSSERAQIYLTNTLEEPHELQPYLETMAPALAHEAGAANRVKASAPITVVIGNPPYALYSGNMTSDASRLIERYRFVSGERIRERGALQLEKNLQDDYVKFFAFSERAIKRTGSGILGFISNHGYLANKSLRGMRESLLSTFNSLRLLDLHGSVSRARNDVEVDQNVFDIQQGVSIGLFASLCLMSENSVRHFELTGSREAKYGWLTSRPVDEYWQELRPTPPEYFFIPFNSKLREEYQNGRAINELMPVFSSGMVTARDAITIWFDENRLLRFLSEFVALDSETTRKRFDLGKDTKDWSVERAQDDVRIHLDEQSVSQVLYRPFDLRFTLFTGKARGFICNPRRPVFQHIVGKENIALVINRQVNNDFSHVLVTRSPIDTCTLSSATRETAYAFPLYLYPTDRDEHFGGAPSKNLSSDLLTVATDGELDTESFINYAYAVFHSPSYRSRYAEFLRIDFPRLPLTSDTELFRKLCSLGADLVALHLLDPDYEGTSWAKSGKYFPPDNASIKCRDNDPVVAAGYPKLEGERVYINKTSYFAGVPEDVWNFHIGGYQVCHKWLKDRKGRTLSTEDQIHYGKIVIALRETIRLMAEIDGVIEAHGGFPLPGSQAE